MTAEPIGAGAAPRRSDARRNHEAIVAAALAVFAEKGSDASIPEVAARAGVGKATVYRNYPTKADLLAAVAQDRLQWLADRSAQAAAENDAWSALHSYTEDVIAHVVVDRTLCEVLRNDETPGSDELRARKAENTAALFAKGHAQGTIRADATADDYRILLGGLADQLHREGETDPAAWRRYAALVVDALRTRD